MNHGLPSIMDAPLDLDAVVVGAGVVGLAVARALALAGREVTVLEAETAIGTHTSSRSSEVIHAGIYYDPGSSKAALCVRGRRLLYEYCAARGVAHRRLGKIIVATSGAQIAALEAYRARAARNGVDDLEWLDAPAVRRLEPAVRAVAGLLSPSTGIIDSHGFMAALRRDAEAAGAHVVLASPLVRGEILGPGRFQIDVGGAEPARARCRVLVNAAGLFATPVARSLEGLPPHTIPPAHYAIGHYFVLAGPAPFARLVYPIPEPGGLGVHVTLDLGGQARFGPDVAWIDRVDYGFDEARAPAFYRAIRAYWPDLPDGALRPGYTGIRPKLAPAGAPAQDFALHGSETHGVAGLVNLYGIESPGLTAALAIAEEVAARIAADA